MLDLSRGMAIISNFNMLIASLLVLFVLLAECYERTSVMISSNLPFSQWERIFKDPMTTAAAIDRLVHHSMILELNLDSYRLAPSKATTVNQEMRA